MVGSVPYSCNKTVSEMTYLFDVFVYSGISMLLLFCVYTCMICFKVFTVSSFIISLIPSLIYDTSFDIYSYKFTPYNNENTFLALFINIHKLYNG